MLLGTLCRIDLFFNLVFDLFELLLDFQLECSLLDLNVLLFLLGKLVLEAVIESSDRIRNFIFALGNLLIH